MHNPLQCIKRLNAITPASVNGAATAIALDIHGNNAQFVSFELHTAALGTDLGTAPYITECDTSGGTYTTISGFAATIVSTSTLVAGTFVVIDVEWSGARKRYAKLNVATGGATVISGRALLWSGKSMTTASDIGAVEWVKANG